jgi:5-formyltetrahydrofolate cyclo-ligase
MTPTETKKNIRSTVLSLRNSLTLASVRTNSNVILQHLFQVPAFQQAKTMCTYISFGSEVRTHAVLEYCWNHSIPCIVPKVDKTSKELRLYLIEHWLDLQRGYKGILEPRKHCKLFSDIQNLDCFIIPGIVFTQAGMRVGYGGGFYDKLLSILPDTKARIGLCYSFQLLDDLPREKHDQPMHTIVTEQQILTCST